MSPLRMPEGDLLRGYVESTLDDDDGFLPFDAAYLDIRRHAVLAVSGRADMDLELRKVLPSCDERFHQQITTAVNKGKGRCESPIEDILFPRLVAQEYSCFRYNPAVLLPGEQGDYVPFTVCVIPQLPVRPYRADFALAASRGGLIKFVLVECDEATRDAARDARLRSNPRILDIVRIPGGAILAAPEVAARRAERALLDAWRGPSTPLARGALQ